MILRKWNIAQTVWLRLVPRTTSRPAQTAMKLLGIIPSALAEGIYSKQRSRFPIKEFYIPYVWVPGTRRVRSCQFCLKGAPSLNSKAGP